MGEKAQCGDETLNYDQCVEGVRILGYTTLFAGTFFFVCRAFAHVSKNRSDDVFASLQGFTTFVTIYFIRLLPAIKEHFWAEEDLLQMCYENMETQKKDQPIPEVESDESASSPQGFVQQSIELAEFHQFVCLLVPVCFMYSTLIVPLCDVSKQNKNSSRS